MTEPICRCGHLLSAHDAGECWTAPDNHEHPDPKCQCDWYDAGTPHHHGRTPEMNGPEHYREAERLLTPAVYDEGEDAELHQRDIARAQMHATLAHAAAAALPTVTDSTGDYGLSTDWARCTARPTTEEGTP